MNPNAISPVKRIFNFALSNGSQQVLIKKLLPTPSQFYFYSPPELCKNLCSLLLFCSFMLLSSPYRDFYFSRAQRTLFPIWLEAPLLFSDMGGYVFTATCCVIVISVEITIASA